MVLLFGQRDMIWPQRQRLTCKKCAVAKKLALIVLTLSFLTLLLTFFFEGKPAQAVFCFLVMTLPVALMVLGASRGGEMGSLFWALLALWIVLEASILTIFSLKGAEAEIWIGGFPAATAIMLYGIWLTPLGLVALAYAWTFSRSGLSRQDLERVRRFRSSGREVETSR
jgi:hypothetical protein